jgi:hypothetical protein
MRRYEKAFRIALVVGLVVVLSGCAGSVRPATPLPVTVEPGGRVTPYDAALMITDFASKNLGLSVQDVKARGAQGEVSLPSSVYGDLSAAISLAGPAAAGTFTTVGGEKGLAEVALGSGNISGDMVADLAGASIGAYSLLIRESPPQDAAAALGVLNRAFPLLSQANLEQQDSAVGYVYYGLVSGRKVGVGEGGVEITVDAQATVAGVNSRGRNTVVWVAMALGELSGGLNRKSNY